MGKWQRRPVIAEMYLSVVIAVWGTEMAGGEIEELEPWLMS